MTTKNRSFKLYDVDPIQKKISPLTGLVECKSWYENGQLFEHYFKDDNGERQGEYKSWWSNGKLWDHCFYNMDKRISKEEYYDLQMKKKLENINEWGWNETLL